MGVPVKIENPGGAPSNLDYLILSDDDLRPTGAPTNYNVCTNSFSVDPDDAGDPDAGIQTAIDEAAAAGGGDVFVYKRTYNISVQITIKAGVRLVGVGCKSDAVIKCDTDITDPIFKIESDACLEKVKIELEVKDSGSATIFEIDSTASLDKLMLKDFLIETTGTPATPGRIVILHIPAGVSGNVDGRMTNSIDAEVIVNHTGGGASDEIVVLDDDRTACSYFVSAGGSNVATSAHTTLTFVEIIDAHSVNYSGSFASGVGGLPWGIVVTGSGSVAGYSVHPVGSICASQQFCLLGDFEVHDDFLLGSSPIRFEEDPIGTIKVNGSFHVTGKLTVDGLIDPTGLVLSEQATVPGGAPGAGEATFWVRNDVPNIPIFTDDGGTDRILGTLAAAGVDNRIVRFDGTTGLQSSLASLTDAGLMTVEVDGIGGGFRAGASGDVQWYRGGADKWQTPDSVEIDGHVGLGSGGSVLSNAILFASETFATTGLADGGVISVGFDPQANNLPISGLRVTATNFALGNVTTGHTLRALVGAASHQQGTAIDEVAAVTGEINNLDGTPTDTYALRAIFTAVAGGINVYGLHIPEIPGGTNRRPIASDAVNGWSYLMGRLHLGANSDPGTGVELKVEKQAIFEGVGVEPAVLVATVNDSTRDTGIRIGSGSYTGSALPSTAAALAIALGANPAAGQGAITKWHGIDARVLWSGDNGTLAKFIGVGSRPGLLSNAVAPDSLYHFLAYKGDRSFTPSLPSVSTVGYGMEDFSHTGDNDVIGYEGVTFANGTNRYGMKLPDQTGGTIARILELGPTPYLRLRGSGEWAAAANETPLSIAEGATPTLRGVNWKDGGSIGAGDKVMVLV